MVKLDPSLFSELLKLGTLGPVVLTLAWYVFKLHTALREVEAQRVSDAKETTDRIVKLQNQVRETEEARTKDAQAVVDRLLSLNDRWNSTMEKQARAMDNASTALGAIQVCIKDMDEVMSDLITKVHGDTK